MANQMVLSGKKVHDEASSSGLTREQSFARVPQQNKRRSLTFQSANSIQHESLHHQMRSKPAIEIYRPPSKKI